MINIWSIASTRLDRHKFSAYLHNLLIKNISYCLVYYHIPLQWVIHTKNVWEEHEYYYCGKCLRNTTALTLIFVGSTFASVLSAQASDERGQSSGSPAIVTWNNTSLNPYASGIYYNGIDNLTVNVMLGIVINRMPGAQNNDIDINNTIGIGYLDLNLSWRDNHHWRQSGGWRTDSYRRE